MRKWPLLLLLLTLIGGALALGIGPAKVDLKFNDSSPQIVTLFAVNSKDVSVNASVTVDGDLTQFVTIENKIFELAPHEKKWFNVTISIPANYSNGSYTTYVGVEELSNQAAGGTGLAAETVSASTVHVDKVFGSGFAVAAPLQNQTNQTNQTTYTGPPPNFFLPTPPGSGLKPPEKKSLLEQLTGGFASFLSPISSKLSELTWQQWLVVGLFTVLLVLLYSYLHEPKQPEYPAYSPYSYYPRPPQNYYSNYGNTYRR